MAHTWARWLHHPCRLGDPHRFRAGGKIRSRPTSGQGGYITPAASRIPTASKWGAKSEVAHRWARLIHHPCRLGDPHRFKVGGEIRPIHGQGGYITPAASGIANASEQRAKSEVGPRVGKVATSPLPPRGSPPLQSGGQNQKSAHQWARWLHHPCRLGDPHRFRAGGKIISWPTSGQGGYVTPTASGIPTASERG